MTASAQKEKKQFQHIGQDSAPVKARPFIKWAGGKSALLSAIAKRVPKDVARYHEPFLGGGAVFFGLVAQNLKRDKRLKLEGQNESLFRASTLSDSNPDLINTYQVVRNKVEELIEDLRRHRYEKEYFYKIRNADREANYKYWSDVQRASRFIFLNKTCFNGLYRLNSKGQFNTPFGRYKNPKFLDADNLRACSEALSHVRVVSQDFRKVVELSESSDFVYFDPPYAPLNKTSNFTSYTKDGFGQQEHEELAEVCKELHSAGVRFLLSNSDTDFTRDLYKDFHSEQVFAPRAINSKSAKRGSVSELLVWNEL